MFNMFTKIIPFLSSVKGLAVALPILSLALAGAGKYLHSSGYHSGYEKAELVCAAERESGKDEALQELLRLQAESLEVLKENRALNASINKEVRKEDDNVTERVETIIREQPILIDPESCRRGYGVVELLNELSSAGSASGDSTSGDTEGVSE